MPTKRHILAALFAFSMTVPRLFGSPVQPGVYYVAAYSASGTHTDYDLARQAADAYAAANPWSGSVLVLKTGVNYTCDASPLPSLGLSGTTSIIGFGSGKSRITKNTSCPASAATLRHSDSPNGHLSKGWFQGFTVDANHIDQAACEFYGMSLTTFIDVSCGNAIANADHELEFGNRDANNYGWMDNIYIYGLQTFDSAPVGQGAILTPIWAGGVLSAVRLTTAGAGTYTRYARAQLVGPDTVSCSAVPTVQLTLSNASYITGAIVASPGNCQSTTHIHILVQDGTPVTYGMKFSNLADSHAWILKPTGANAYGEAWLNGSANNSIYNETLSSNQIIQLFDNANGNRHISPVFTNPGGYAAAIYSQNGTIANATLSWDNAISYVSASGYFAGNDPRVFQDWMIQNSVCINSSGPTFIPLATQNGIPSASIPLPVGLRPQNIESCDGTNTVHWGIDK